MCETTLRAVYRTLEAERDNEQLTFESREGISDLDYAEHTGRQAAFTRAMYTTLDLSEY